MADLSVNTGGLSLKNPIVVASSPLTSRLDRVKAAEEGGAAAVSLKHSLLKQKFFAKPRWYAEKGQGIIVSGDPRLEVDEACELVRQSKEQTDLKVIVNMSGLATDVNTWGDLAVRFAQAGADAIELNLNCPNLHTAQERGPALGANLGQDPESCAEVVKNIKSKVAIPVIAKLPTEGGRLPAVSKSCDEAGVDILNIHAGFRAAPGLDIYKGGAMKYPGSGQGPLGGYSGPWSRLISNRFIADVSRACKAPVMGSGGIRTWQHVVESIMYGAQSIQLCTVLMTEGFELIGKMMDAMNSYMDEMGYATIEDFRGLAIQNILGPGEMQYADVTAQINTDKCSGCAKCTGLPTCDAIQKVDKKCVVDPEKCVACGLCVSVCPTDSITFVPKTTA
ncbi:4Fe-4S binding protein [Clostridia bacterium OttesenSCG-928-O13]|nr:4Fe-4S binding protein [Clostridia bacterium OttesenSCG-928-O13]